MKWLNKINKRKGSTLTWAWRIFSFRNWKNDNKIKTPTRTARRSWKNKTPESVQHFQMNYSSDGRLKQTKPTKLHKKILPWPNFILQQRKKGQRGSLPPEGHSKLDNSGQCCKRTAKIPTQLSELSRQKNDSAISSSNLALQAWKLG